MKWVTDNEPWSVPHGAVQPLGRPSCFGVWTCNAPGMRKFFSAVQDTGSHRSNRSPSEEPLPVCSLMIHHPWSLPGLLPWLLLWKAEESPHTELWSKWLDMGTSLAASRWHRNCRNIAVVLILIIAGYKTHLVDHEKSVSLLFQQRGQQHHGSILHHS